jgi:microcystin-dependent protein
MHPGQGPGLSLHDLGETGGTETVTLLESEIPAHSHTALPKTSLGNSQTPVGQAWAGSTIAKQYVSTNPDVSMNFLALSPSGGNLPHNNLSPYLVFNFCIALQGVFPARP